MTPASRFSTISRSRRSRRADQRGQRGGAPDPKRQSPSREPCRRLSEVGSGLAESGAGAGFIRGYCVSDAAYFASLGEPPATQAFRGGLAVLGKYVDVLIFLAEGRNLEELHAQLDSLSSTIGQVLTFLPGGGVRPALRSAARSAR